MRIFLAGQAWLTHLTPRYLGAETVLSTTPSMPFLLEGAVSKMGYLRDSQQVDLQHLACFLLAFQLVPSSWEWLQFQLEMRKDFRRFLCSGNRSFLHFQLPLCVCEREENKTFSSQRSWKPLILFRDLKDKMNVRLLSCFT